MAWRFLLVFIFFLSYGAPEVGAQGEVPLAEEHRRWLEEEVVYIITDKEKAFFLPLKTLEERQNFIEAFWRRRDTKPATPENEFKIEH